MQSSVARRGREYPDHQKERGRTKAAATVFNTITISDGISMGSEGMEYSLVSRETIADSIEPAI